MEEKEPVFRHHVPVQMRFADIDILGHVNNGAYLQYMDLAKVRYFSETLADTLDWHKETLVVANINCTFMAPTFWGDEIEVVTTIESISVHSLILLQRVVDTRTKSHKMRNAAPSWSDSTHATPQPSKYPTHGEAYSPHSSNATSKPTHHIDC